MGDHLCDLSFTILSKRVFDGAGYYDLIAKKLWEKKKKKSA